MKRATQTMFGSVLLVLVSGGAMLVAACASDTGSNIPGDGTGSSTSQTEPASSSSSGSSNSGGSSSNGSGSSGNGSGSTKQCVSKCMQDTDCANSCPLISGAISCCDQNTNVCYSTKQSMCPAPQQMDDAGSGGGTPAY